MPGVKSFDVFDTLLTRKVGLPGHIFLLTGQRIADQFGLDIEPEVFANARSIAERELVRQGLVSSDIYDIYKKLTATLELPEELSPKLAGVELETEYREIIAVEKNVQLVEQFRSEGEQVIYISDMYLGEPVIRKLLTDRGICREGEQIYVSCDHGVNKSSGKLFDVVTGDLGIEKHQLHHYGNSMRSDIKGAEKAGVRATYLEDCNLNRYEKQLCNVNEKHRLTADQALLYSRMAAAARLSRLEREEDQSREIYDVASCVAAPILYRFVDYVLSEAGDKKIYFLARDGHIMYQIAERIIKARGYKTEIKYLYISREALVLAMFDEMDFNKYLEFVTEIFANESLGEVFKKLSVSPEKSNNLNLRESVNKKLLDSFRKEELQEIFSDKTIYTEVKKDSGKRKHRLLTYFRSEDLLKNDRVIVDVGWGLTIQNLMADLFTSEGISPPEGYYFGINESAGSSTRKGKKNGYLWDKRKNRSFEPAHKIIRIFEVFCSAPHGQTVDFKIDRDSIQPVLNSHEAEHLINWGLNDMQAGILNSAENLMEVMAGHKTFEKDPMILMDLIEMFWLQPTREEINVWGKYPYSIIKHKKRVVNLFTKEPFHKLLFHSLKKGKLPNSSLDHWPHAIVHSLPPLKKNTLTNTLKAKRAFSHFKNSRLIYIMYLDYALSVAAANWQF